jgi:tetratricopeptide (TPR) repeat protein
MTPCVRIAGTTRDHGQEHIMLDCDEANARVYAGDPNQVPAAIDRLGACARERPDDPLAWYRYGSALDYYDREAEAIVAYDRALALGVERLPPDLQPQLYVQAGSTLRNLGRLDDARSLLQQGRERFPGYRALAAFLALVEVSSGDDRRAITLLFDALLDPSGEDDASLRRFHRALAYYAAEIAPRATGSN